MARIRTIKPDFWTDEKIVELSFEARLFFVGSWNFADDNGNLQRSAKKMKMQIFPADAIDCEPLVQSLIDHGLFIEYSVNSEEFIHIKGFKDHQVVNRPSKSNIPEPKTGDLFARLTEDSLTEGKGKEGKGRDMSGTPDDVTSVIDYLNEKAGRNYQAVPANTKLVAARIREGASIEQIKAVIDTKVAEWGEDPKMSAYLRPETLFGATKYAQYVGALGSSHSNGHTDNVFG